MAQLDFLTDEEIREITGKRTPAAQYRCLVQMSIPCIQRPDRSILVLRANALKRLGMTAEPKKNTEPNWSALRV